MSDVGARFRKCYRHFGDWLAAAIRRNFTLQAVRALGTGTSTAVLIRFGAVLDEVVALRLSTDATDAADIGDGRVAIGL